MENLIKKTAFSYEYLKSNDDYKKPVDNLKKEDFFTELRNKCTDNEEPERTKEIIKTFDNKMREKLGQLYLKIDVILLAEVFENFKILIKYQLKKLTSNLYIVWVCLVFYGNVD